jgi:uncharacterized membrane protein YccC
LQRNLDQSDQLQVAIRGALVSQIVSFWKGFCAWIRQHRAQLRLSFRVAVAALLSLALAQFLQLPLPLWAVLTAVVVTQVSVGRSLKATTDYLAGTLGGAIYGGAIAVLIPHSDQIALLAVLALAVGPLALLAAINPSLAAAPVTAIIVLLIPEATYASPIDSILDRVLEVALGGLSGLVVSLLLLPSRAHRLVAETAAPTLDRMARAFEELLAGLTRGLDMASLHRIQDGIGQTLAQLQAVGAEAERERSAHLTSGADTGPLLRTLLRLRHDIVMIGRAAIVPLPDAFRGRLEPSLTQIAATFTDHLRSSGAALLARRAPPSLDAVKSALHAYAADIAALRREGLTRGLPGDAAERLFALGFALEQMYQNLKDLERCVADWVELPKSSERGVPEGAAH